MTGSAKEEYCIRQKISSMTPVTIFTELERDLMFVPQATRERFSVQDCEFDGVASLYSSSPSPIKLDFSNMINTVARSHPLTALSLQKDSPPKSLDSIFEKWRACEKAGETLLSCKSIIVQAILQILI